MIPLTKSRRNRIIVGAAIGVAAISLAAGLVSGPSAEASSEATKAGCTHYVSVEGKDTRKGTRKSQAFGTIQHALNVVTKPGSTICVLAGTYPAGISFPADGSQDKFITLRNYPAHRPILTGENAPGDARLVDINDRSWVRFQGFEVKDWESTTQSNAGGIIVQGSGTNIEIIDNKVHDFFGEYLEGENGEVLSYGNTRPIAAWGTSEETPLRNVVIRDNEVYRSTTVDAESVHVSGNVDGFEVSGNKVYDSDGFLYGVGGGLLPPYFSCSLVQPRNGVLKDNLGYYTVWDRITSQPAIYLDGVKNVVVDSNTVFDASYGILVTFEQYCAEEFDSPVINEDITIQNNLVYGNRTAGVWIGSPYRANGTLQVDGAVVRNNTIFQNGTEWGNAGTSQEGNFGIGAARNVQVYSNVFADSDYRATTALAEPYENITFDHNLYYSFVDRYDTAAAESASFQYAGETYTGFEAYRAATGQDLNSIFARPVFTDLFARDFRLREGSPGVDAGSSVEGQFAPLAIDGTERPQGVAPDVGAYER